MTGTLDLSVGKEHRVSVGVSGWKPQHKQEFAAKAQLRPGVTSVHSAGGSSSFYVYYDPAIVSEAEINASLTKLAHRIGVFDGTSAIEAASSIVEAIPDDVEVVAVNSSAWTGITSVQERIAAFKQLAPMALAAVDRLIVELEVPGDNGGPPLDERQEAIDALRQLHNGLGDLLAAVEKPGFAWADGEGLAASCAHFAMRAADKLRDDPMPFAVSGLLLALCSVCGFPGIGGWLAAATLEMQIGAKRHTAPA